MQTGITNKLLDEVESLRKENETIKKELKMIYTALKDNSYMSEIYLEKLKKLCDDVKIPQLSDALGIYNKCTHPNKCIVKVSTQGSNDCQFQNSQRYYCPDCDKFV